MLKGWKTLFFGAAVIAVPVLDYSLNQSALINLIPDEYREVAISLVGLVIIVLRMATTTPVMQGEKE